MSTTKSQSLESPLSKAKGLGSTHHGMEHWLMQRVTAVSNLVLMIWLVWSVTHFVSWDYVTFTTWLKQPMNAVLMILAICSTFYHAVLGVQVIAEDYIQGKFLLVLKIYGTKLFFIAAAVASVFSILKIAFAG